MSALPADPIPTSVPIIFGPTFPHDSIEETEHGLQIWGPVTTTDYYTAEILQKYGCTLRGSPLLYGHRWPLKEKDAYLGRVTETLFNPEEGKLYARAEIYADTDFQQRIIGEIVTGKTVGVSIGLRSLEKGPEGAEKEDREITKMDILELSVLPNPDCKPPMCGIEGHKVFEESTPDTEPTKGSQNDTEVVTVTDEVKVKAKVNVHEDKIAALNSDVAERDAAITKLENDAVKRTEEVQTFEEKTKEEIKTLKERTETFEARLREAEVVNPLRRELISKFHASPDSEKRKEITEVVDKWNEEQIRSALMTAKWLPTPDVLAETDAVISLNTGANVGITKETAAAHSEGPDINAAIKQLYKDAGYTD